MKNNNQNNTEVLDEKEKLKQKKKSFKIDKKHIQGFIAGVLVSAIAFTGLLAGVNPSFLTGAALNPASYICDISLGHVRINNANGGTSLTYSDRKNHQVTEWIKMNETEITIKGSTSKYKIDIGYNVTANIVLDGVNIQSADSSPFWIEQSAKVILTLKNKNDLSSGTREAINMYYLSTLEIFGSGSLTIIGGTGKPGISPEGRVQIHSDNVTVIGK